MMGFCKIFFLDGPFWRFFGIEDLFFFFWSSRPISAALWRVRTRDYWGMVVLVEGAVARRIVQKFWRTFCRLGASLIDSRTTEARPPEATRQLLRESPP